MGALHSLNDMRVEFVLNGGTSSAESVFHRSRLTAAVGDDADTIDSKQRTTAVFVSVGDGVDRAEGGLAKLGAEHTDGVGEQLAPQQIENAFGQGVAGFQH